MNWISFSTGSLILVGYSSAEVPAIWIKDYVVMSDNFRKILQKNIYGHFLVLG